MGTAQPDDRPNVWSMAVVHQFYRREFDLAPRIIRDLTPDQTGRFEQAASWFAICLAMMHHHHIAEDTLMYPLLEGRIDQDLLDRMEDQHDAVAAAVAGTEARIAQWQLRDATTSAALADSFDALLPILVGHLDDEEDLIMPLVGDLLTAEEYARQGVSGNAALEPRTLMMAFGAMVEQASEYEAGVMLAHPPEHVRRAWFEHGAEQYRAMMTLLRGGLEPIGRRGPPRRSATRVPRPPATHPTPDRVGDPADP